MLNAISTDRGSKLLYHDENRATSALGLIQTEVARKLCREANDRSSQSWLVEPFKPISLEQLNAKASMLVRLDNKYVLHADAVQQAIAEFSECFDVLEIDGLRRFNYETCYFDDADSTSYYDHHRGRKKRFKVRMRKYLEAQLCFVEIKLKGKRGITIKKRLKQPVDQYGRLDDAALKHVHEAYAGLYGREYNRVLKRSVEMRYQRVTLVAKEGDERMTIDSNLEFMHGDRSLKLDPNTFIIETKSPKANGIADKILRRLHKHPTKRCSKYCVAMASLQVVSKYNKFRPAMRRLGVLPDEAGSLKPSVLPSADTRVKLYGLPSNTGACMATAH